MLENLKGDRSKEDIIRVCKTKEFSPKYLYAGLKSLAQHVKYWGFKLELDEIKSELEVYQYERLLIDSYVYNYKGDPEPEAFSFMFDLISEIDTKTKLRDFRLRDWLFAELGRVVNIQWLLICKKSIKHSLLKGELIDHENMLKLK